MTSQQQKTKMQKMIRGWNKQIDFRLALPLGDHFNIEILKTTALKVFPPEIRLLIKSRMLKPALLDVINMALQDSNMSEEEFVKAMFREAEVSFVDNEVVPIQPVICEKVLEKAMEDVKHMKIAVHVEDYSNDSDLDDNQEADDIRNQHLHDMYYGNVKK